MQEYAIEEIQKQNGKNGKNAWVIVGNKVLDVTKFANIHPGGAQLLLESAGQDVTNDFYAMHRHDVLEKYAPKLQVGKVKNSRAEEIQSWKDFSKVPYAEPSFFQGLPGPYMNDSHIQLRKELRAFYDSIRDIADESERLEKPPSRELYRKLGDAGILATFLGPGKHLQHAPKGLPAGIKPENFDYFHEAICHEEMSRLFAPGFEDGISSGVNIGTPVLIHFGSSWMKEQIVPKVISGEQIICLAITEAFGGSDVAGLKTTAVKDPSGQFYIVNGTKKWITNATFADYFVTAVRTGGPGSGGVSMLLIPRTEGVETKVIKTSYSSAAGTGFIIFENVRVPVNHLIGTENQGFKLIMTNFLHERWSIVSIVLAKARYVTEECFKWTNQRVAFGKKLSAQPVLMEKLADMVAFCESAYAWQMEITYQMTKMSILEQNEKLSGKVALLKYVSTEVSDMIANHAVQIFGGRGMTKGGMGNKIETFQRTHKFVSVYGGSREIMANLGIKTALRSFPSDSKL